MFLTVSALFMQPVPASDVLPPQIAPGAQQAGAQEAGSTGSAAVEAAGEAPPATALILPKGQQILIVIDAQIGSKISQTGDTFPIRLAQAVTVGEIEVLPAGIVGQAQVVHAKKGGMSGAAGELVLAARYLDYAGRRIDLRSFKFAEEGDANLMRGKDNIDLAAATNAVVGPLGFLIGGGNTVIEPGTVATAKTRNDEVFAIVTPAPDNSN